MIIDSKGDQAGFARCVNYRGTVPLLTGPLANIGWLLGGAETVDISGGIAFHRQPPGDGSHSQTTGAQVVGQFQLGFALHLTTKVEDDNLDASFRLVTVLGARLRGVANALTVIGEFDTPTDSWSSRLHWLAESRPRCRTSRASQTART